MHYATPLKSMLATACLLAACSKSETTSAPEYGETPPEHSGMEAPAAAAPADASAVSADTTQTGSQTPTQPAEANTVLPAERAAKISAPVAEPLNDAQIVKVMASVDSGEIAQAKVANNKAKHAQVKTFARHMVQEHTAAKQQGTQLAKKAKLVPADSTLSEDLTKSGSQTLAALKSADAASFDKLYIDGQVQQHQEVLDLLDNHLIPRATEPSLKSQLEKARTMVDAHLNKAKEIQGVLGNAS
jgi:putative membrane protein